MPCEAPGMQQESITSGHWGRSKEGVKITKGTVKKKEEKKRWRAAGHFEKTHLVLSHGIKKAHVTEHLYLCSFELFPALNSSAKPSRIGQRRRETAQRWGAHAYGGFCSYSCMRKTIICLETPHFCQPVISEPAERNRTKRNNRTGIIMRRQPPTSPNCVFFFLDIYVVVLCNLKVFYIYSEKVFAYLLHWNVLCQTNFSIRQR